MNRVRAGFCEVPNPYNASQVSVVRLDPDAVDAVVFWTRSPRPMLESLPELDRRGFRYYFQYTLIGYPRSLDPLAPPARTAVETFRRLSGEIGSRRVIWRYDPIVISAATPPDDHRRRFERLARALEGFTRRVVISFVDDYARTRRRMAALSSQGAAPIPIVPGSSGALPDEIAALVSDLAGCAAAHGMEIHSCAELLDLQPYGVAPGKCIDPHLLEQVFGIELHSGKDPYQRPACGCAASKDIGMYDSCLFGCSYCYATGSFARARRSYRIHDPNGPALLAAPQEADRQE